MTANRVVDARNSFCPGPMMELMAAMKMSQVGDVLELLSTDNGTAHDVPEWANKVGHEMVGTTQQGDVWHIQVRKMTANRVVDGRNSFCPGPLMELIAAMKMSQVGDAIELLSTDKGTATDVPEWINKVGHEMLGTTKHGNVWHILVRKKK